MWLDVLGSIHGLPCASGDMSKCKGGCEDRKGFYLGKQWPKCPVKELHADERLLYVLSLDAQAQLSPIAGWPDAYAAWVPRTWAKVVAARNDRKANEVSHGG